jgi:hypothetical protein
MMAGGWALFLIQKSFFKNSHGMGPSCCFFDLGISGLCSRVFVDLYSLNHDSLVHR